VLIHASVCHGVAVSEEIGGPQSYFPSIPRKYSHPMEHWFSALNNHSDAAHIEMVGFLVNDYGMGHGHANAIAAHYRAGAR
jgi:hypothetical protein